MNCDAEIASFAFFPQLIRNQFRTHKMKNGNTMAKKWWANNNFSCLFKFIYLKWLQKWMKKNKKKKETKFASIQTQLKKVHRRNAHRKQKITKTFLTMCLQFPISSLLFFLFLQLFNSNACCFCYLCWCCWWCSCYCGRYLLLMLLPLFKFSFGANIQNSLFVSWVFLCRIGSRIIIYVCISLVCSLALSAYLSAHKCNILCTFATISFSVRFNAISFDSRQFCTPSFLLDFAFFSLLKQV